VSRGSWLLWIHTACLIVALRGLGTRIGNEDWGGFVVAYLLCQILFLAGYAAIRHGSLPGPGRWSLVLAPLILRVAVLDTPSGLTSDLERYRADASRLVHCQNPYATLPEPRPNLEHRDVPTIYPPIAQLSFAIAWLAGGTDLAFRILYGGLDFLGYLTLLLIFTRSRDPTRALIWGLNPLCVLESSGVGHLDAAALLPLVLTFLVIASRPGIAGVLLALSVGTKLGPLILLPVLAPALGRAGLSTCFVTLGLLSIPMILGDFHHGLYVYLGQWEFNGLIHGLLTRAGVGANIARSICYGALALVIASTRASNRAREVASARIIFAWILLSPTLHNWYLAWAVPFLAWSPSPSILLATLIGGLSYGVLIERSTIGTWEEGRWWWIESTGIFFAVFLEVIWRRVQMWLATQAPTGLSSGSEHDV